MNKNEFPYPVYNEKGNIICQLCGKDFRFLSPQHLKKEHQITTAEYKQRFHGAVFTSKSSKIKMSESSKIWHEKRKQQENFTVENNIVINEDEYDKLMKESKEDFDNSIVMKNYDIEPQIQVNENDLVTLSFQNIEISKDKDKEENNDLISPNKILKNKYLLYNELKKILRHLQMNYFIEKKSIDGIIEYLYITDFCDPNMKIVIDFPYTFWHNSDYRPDRNKSAKLNNDGWKFITIEKNENAIEKVKKYLNIDKKQTKS